MSGERADKDFWNGLGGGGVGKILTAERVEGSEKLLRLEVDFGEEVGIRQILAGIGKAYVPDELIGREIVVVVNLEPRMMMGLQSQGMLLAVDGGEGPVLLCPQREVFSGSPVR